MTRPEVALITGAAQGLGAAIARALHEAGVRVAVTDLSLEKARATADSLDGTGKTVRALPLDVRRKADFAAAIDSLADWGGVDILVNNAAIAPTTSLFDISGDEFDAVMAVNLRGPFFGCQVVGEHLRQRGHGRIINIASQAGQMGGTVTGAHYAASKAGLILLTKIFARDLAGSNVTVNAVAPGALDMPAVRAAFPPQRLRALETAIPVGRLGSPEEVAEVVVLLASRQAGYITGATWDVNGGTFMR